MMSSMASSGAASGTGGASGYMQIAGTLLSAYGQQQQAAGAANTGANQLQLARFQAAQMRENAGTAKAAAQRTAADIDRDAQYSASRALAVAAASGGGASDPTVINVIAQTAGEAAYRKSLALYQGADRARSLESQAKATIVGGEMAASNASGSSLGALTTLFKGGASLYSKYAGGGPSAGGTSGTDTMTQQANAWGQY